MNPPIKEKYIKSPEYLLELFERYVLHTKATPKQENVLHQKSGEIIQVPRERPISFVGFENWLFKEGIISQLRSYEQNENESYTAYLPIISRIKAFIYEDKADGATVGIFNASIIARELGLTEKTETESKITQTTKIDLTALSDDELRILAEMQRKSGISQT